MQYISDCFFNLKTSVSVKQPALLKGVNQDTVVQPNNFGCVQSTMILQFSVELMFQSIIVVICYMRIKRDASVGFTEDEFKQNTVTVVRNLITVSRIEGVFNE
jgi:hypothetical protein